MSHQCKIWIGLLRSEKGLEKKFRSWDLNWYAKGGWFHGYFRGTQMTNSEGLNFTFDFVTPKYILWASFTPSLMTKSQMVFFCQPPQNMYFKIPWYAKEYNSTLRRWKNRCHWTIHLGCYLPYSFHIMLWIPFLPDYFLSGGHFLCRPQID